VDQALKNQIAQDQATVYSDQGWVGQEQTAYNGAQGQEQSDSSQCSSYEQSLANPGPDQSAFGTNWATSEAQQYCTAAQNDSGSVASAAQRLQEAESALQQADSQLQQDQAALSSP
jgi:hypothetical protein